MFDIGFFELMIIMGIAVVVIGPQNLPKLAKAIGKGWGEFQRTFSGLKQEVMDGINIEKKINQSDSVEKKNVITNLKYNVELENTSIIQIYLENNQLEVQVLGRGMTWLDTGTHDSLIEARQFV